MRRATSDSDQLVALTAGFDQLCASIQSLVQLQSEQIHSRQRREWEPFAQPFAGTTDATGVGSARIQCPPGWEWELGRTMVTLSGANHSADVTAYVNTDGAFQGADQSAVDFEVGFWGDSPSRALSDNKWPVYVGPGNYYVVGITGGDASVQTIACVATGRRRQV